MEEVHDLTILEESSTEDLSPNVELDPRLTPRSTNLDDTPEAAAPLLGLDFWHDIYDFQEHDSERGPASEIVPPYIAWAADDWTIPKDDGMLGKALF